MNIKQVVSMSLRLSAVVVVMIISAAIAAGIGNPAAAAHAAAQTPAEAAQAGLALLVVSAVNALLLAYPIIRSRWGGLKLIGAITLIFFSVQTFMSQIETVFFGSAFNIPAAELRGFFVTGFLTAALFSPAAVLILGRRRAAVSAAAAAGRLTRRQWTGRLALLPLAYIALYFLFGYYVAFQSAEVRLLYSGSVELKPFWSHMADIARSAPDLILLQYGRGLIWIGLALPVMRLMRGGTWEKSIVVGLLFGLLLTTQLLYPNPYMAAPVRLAHFVETSTSTFLYGWLIVQALTPATVTRPAAGQAELVQRTS